MGFKSGRHFLQIPGPTNVPERVLSAMCRSTIDHRGPEFAKLSREVFEGLKRVFKTSGPIILYPSSGTGAWEASLVNTLSPGDRILMFETGHFAALWRNVALRLGFEVDFVPGDWRHGVDPGAVENRLHADPERAIKAVALVHNETSTGITSRVDEVRNAIDRVGHPALLLVDTISSLGSIEYRHEEWRVDVSVGCSQKGLLLPPGIGINAVSEKALAAAKTAAFPKSYWDWTPMISDSKAGFFPYTPATNMLFGLHAALDILFEEGLDHVFARHNRLAEATRLAVGAWDLELLPLKPEEYSSSVTAVLIPDGHDADAFRTTVLEHFDLSLGTGLGKLKGKVFRIGHLGSLNDLMLAGTLSGLEMGLKVAGVPFRKGGVQAALDYLASTM